ncbi:MAG: hypothetical protein AAB368_12905 [bacterium]
MARLLETRAAILAVTEGFTEIPPGVCQELIPGDGVGYIVALKSAAQTRALQAKLRTLAAKWKVPSPRVAEAAKGPRRNFCFFLIPERANPDRAGVQRPLFSAERWARIYAAIRHTLSHRVEFVYGEWRPKDSAAMNSTDGLRMFMVPWQSPATEAFLKHFIQTRVFDGGRECDQWCIYLSCRGNSLLVMERGRRRSV